jgi:catechol 2,3-dioxygenase-like lactoylglutathione lyase family enzyme
VLLFTTDVDRQIDFYTRVLGLKLSDRVKSLIAFMRCTTDHHNLAFLTSKGPGFHHASFQVGSVDEIALGAAHMRDSGWQMGWGLGRHVIGSNYFYYTRDPWGSFAEYYHDLDYIPEECAWVPRDFPEEDCLPLPGTALGVRGNSELLTGSSGLGGPMGKLPGVFFTGGRCSWRRGAESDLRRRPPFRRAPAVHRQPPPSAVPPAVSLQAS